VKVCAASAAVGWAAHRLELLLEPHFAWHQLPGALLLLSVVTTAGVLLLFILGKLLRIREIEAQVAKLWLIASGNRSKSAA
jgi:hypothetical protein